VSVAEQVIGAQTPRVWSVPARAASYEIADEALEWLDEVVGFGLDEWQRLVLRESLAEAQPGTWAATEVGLVVSRQNGKGAILEARELVGLFLLNEPLLIHSAHQFKTAQEHFLRLSARIQDVPELRARLKPKSGIRVAAGEQGVELRSGHRLRILARKGGSGRGFSAPFVAFDEAMDLPEATAGDMVPTQSAMPTRQRWYTGSAVDQLVHTEGVMFARVRERGHAGNDPRLLFGEWSLDRARPEDLTREEMLDDAMIAASNPGYGIRITREAVEEELASLPPRTAAVERYGVGDWPPTSTDPEYVIDPDVWGQLADSPDDADAKILDPVCFAFDVTPDRAFSTVAVAGRRADGLAQVEVAKHGRGTDWVPAWLADRQARHQVEKVLCAGHNSAGLEHLVVAAGVTDLEILSTTEEAKACGHLVDLVDGQQLRHLADELLDAALMGATRRPLADAWAWDRRAATVVISPLVAATAALWGVSKYIPEDAEIRIF
jgi:hypothetical protein